MGERDSEFDFIHNNISLLKNTFQEIKNHNKPFIFTSTQMSDMTHSSYGNAKLVGEKYTKSLNGIFVKLWNVYGPEFHVEDQRRHVITDFIESARKNNYINVRTSGEEKRQFLYVEDCCEALYVLSGIYDKVSRQENLDISSFEWTKIKDLANLVAKSYGCDFTVGQKKDTVQLNLQYEPDRNILKYWTPSTSLDVGIKKIIEISNKYV